MEREKKNPYITTVDLRDATEKLDRKINEVDRKHTGNFSKLSQLVAISEKTNENIIEGNRLLRESFDSFSSELKEERKINRNTLQVITEKVNSHDKELFIHNSFIKEQQRVSDTKKGHLLKWVGALSAIFVAVLAGIFGLVEVLIPYLLGGE